MGRQADPRPLPDVPRAALAAARALFAEHGFDGTALQDVASAVGVTKQAVLHHFRTKDELRQAVLAELFAHWAATLPHLLAGATGGHDRFHAVFGELVRFFCEDRAWATLVVRELLDRPEEARRRMEDDVRPWVEAVAGYVRMAQEEGLVAADVDPEAWTVEMIQLTLFGAATHAALAGGVGGEGEPRLVRELARIARSSLFAAGPQEPKGKK